MRFVRTIALALAALASVATQAQTKITVGHTGVSEWLAAYVAQEEGIFRKHGLDVTLQQVPVGALIPSLQGGSVQILTSPPTNVLMANDGGLDLVFVAGTSVTEKTDQNVALLVASGSGIASPKDLVGKKVATGSLGGFLHVMGRKWLADRGVDTRQVSFVEVNFPQMSDLLKNGTIHAVVTVSPFVQRIVQAGSGTVLGYLPADLPSRTAGAFYTTTRAWAVANPQAVRAFRASIADAAAFAEKNPQAARAHMAKYIKLPPEVLASLPAPRLAPEVTEAQVQFWIDAMHEMGLIKAKPAAARAIAP
jgi:NitT/TauT family transport system substrate-binding protein